MKTPCRYSEEPILRDPAELAVEHLVSEELHHLASARVAVAEYDVLQHDFPELKKDRLISLNPGIRELPASAQDKAVHSIIDDWLLANAGFISSAQAAQTVVNTTIKTDAHRRVAYRPPLYGRAVVVPTDEDHDACRNVPWRRPASRGLLDLKGAGVAPDRTPTSGRQSNGLEYLGIALSDFLVKKAIDEVLRRELPNVWTVPVYAILDLDFNIVGGFHGTGCAGMHVRRAHRRRIPMRDRSVEHKVTFDIESTLRRYGITAATRGMQLHIARRGRRVTLQKGNSQSFGLKNIERIGICLALLRDVDRVTLDRRDVQLAREFSWPPVTAQIVDFGALRIERTFHCPMIRDFDKPGLGEIVWPSDGHFVQPDPTLQLPFEIWQRHALAAKCFMLADDFRHNVLSSTDLRYVIDDLLTALVNRWSLASVTIDPS